MREREGEVCVCVKLCRVGRWLAVHLGEGQRMAISLCSYKPLEPRQGEPTRTKKA